MKRILVLLFLIGAVIASIFAWMLIRPTPESVLKKAVRALTNPSMVSVQWNVQWEGSNSSNQIARSRGWVSYSGLMDFRDLASIRANGSLGYSPTSHESDFETANIILTRDAFAFQENNFSSERSEWVSILAGTSTNPAPWLSMDRNVLLTTLGHSELIPKGKDADLREALSLMNVETWLRVVSSSESIYGGREYMQIHVRVEEEEFSTGLLSLLTAWNGSDATSDQISFVHRVAKSVSSGDWYLMVDERSGYLLSLTGYWNALDDQGDSSGRWKYSAVFGNASGGSIGTTVPNGAVDVTEKILPKKTGSLPSSSDVDGRSEHTQTTDTE